MIIRLLKIRIFKIKKFIRLSDDLQPDLTHYLLFLYLNRGAKSLFERSYFCQTETSSNLQIVEGNKAGVEGGKSYPKNYS